MDLEMKNPAPTVTRRRGEAGFSVIEALIAAGILLIIAIGLIPMFTQSILNNAAGSDSSQSSTFAKDELESLQEMNFNVPDLLLTGATTELTSTDYWTQGSVASVGDEAWTTTAPTTVRPRWTRTTRVSQYSIGSFDDGMLAATERKPGSTQPIEVHFKVIEVQLDSGKQPTSGLPPGPRLVYRIIKPF